MTLTAKKSKHNFKAFLWHAAFLAFAQTFIDVDTIIPAMVIESGGGAFHVGLVSAIMLGGASFTQLFFAPFLSNLKYKKKYLLSGINTRIMSLLALSWLIYQSIYQEGSYILPLIIFLITIFSISGAFTNISYVDILGKSVFSEKRKSFLSARQLIAGIIILFTAGLSKKVCRYTIFPKTTP